MIHSEQKHSASGDDVVQWCEQAEDFNQIHLSEQYAEDTRFGERIVPGVMALGWVSGELAQLGEVLGGDVVLTSMESDFEAPIPLDEEVKVVVRSRELGGSRHVAGFEVTLPDGTLAINGKAEIYLD